MSDLDPPFVLQAEDRELVEWIKKRIIIKGYYCFINFGIDILRRCMMKLMMRI